MVKSAKQLKEKIKQLKSERYNWEEHWQEVADFVLPRKNSVIENRVKGEKVNQYLLDNTALQSNVLLAGSFFMNFLRFELQSTCSSTWFLHRSVYISSILAWICSGLVIRLGAGTLLQ